MVRNLTGGLGAALLAALSGCSPNYSPNTYAVAAVQQANPVQPGIVVGVRAVRISADAAVGTVTGAAAGGIAGSQVDTGGPITALSTLGGSVIGGIVGSGVEHAAGDTNAFEYIVREDDKGALVSVTQVDTVPLHIGERVLVIAGKQARVVRDYTVPVPGEPPATGAGPTGAAKPGETVVAKPGAPIAMRPDSRAAPDVTVPPTRPDGAASPGSAGPAVPALPAAVQTSPATASPAPVSEQAVPAAVPMPASPADRAAGATQPGVKAPAGVAPTSTQPTVSPAAPIILAPPESNGAGHGAAVTPASPAGATTQ